MKKLNRIVAVQVSNLRGEAANWKQQAMIRITKTGLIKTEFEEIASPPLADRNKKPPIKRGL